MSTDNKTNTKSISAYSGSNDGMDDGKSSCGGSSIQEKGGTGTFSPKEDIAKTEDRMVFGIRLVVVFVLVAAALTVCLCVYFYLSNTEQKAFEDQFESDATKVFEALGSTLDNTLGPADSLIVNYLAHARAVNQSLPFVSLPNFAVQASKFLRISRAFRMHFGLIVAGDQLEAWNEYSNSNLGWIDDAVEVLENDPDYKGMIYTDWKRRSCDLYTFGGMPVTEPTNYTNTYLPNWQEFPPLTGAGEVTSGCPYNFDNWSSQDSAAGVLYMMQTQSAVMSPFFGLETDYSEMSAEEAAMTEMAAGWMKKNVGEEYYFEPQSRLVFLLLDTEDSNNVRINTTERHKFAGYLSVAIMFRDLVTNILPPNSNGIMVVVEQECAPPFVAPPFTYRLDAGTPTFLGIGDYHDAKYDHLVYSAGGLQDQIGKSEDSTYTGLPVNMVFCPSVLKVYPSEDLEANHKTNNPVYVTVGAACIFVFTSLVFIMYDLLVARRQKIVMNRALESGAVVSSLFPEEIRQRLYEEQRSRMKQQEKRRKFVTLDSRSEDGADEMVPPTNMLSNDNQIAKLYPESTIFFADLAGFTSWSARRQPQQVFQERASVQRK